MKENKNTCTRKKTRKIIKQKNENNIYNVIVGIKLVELIIIIA